MEQTTSINLILDKLLRHPLMQDLTLETVIDYTVDFMRIVGCPTIFEEKVVILDIKNYRALLPCDYYETIQIRDCKSNKAFISSTDSFHMNHRKDIEGELTYKIQGNIIFTSIKEGQIEFAYRAIAVDNEGYPLLPDNSEFTRALEYYIKMKYFEILFDMNKISPQVYQNVQQQYAWAVGACQTEFNRISLDEAQSLANGWKTLLLKTKEHNAGFRFNNVREQIKIH